MDSTRTFKDISRRFADQGYVALAVDLYAGCNRALCMFRFMNGLLFNSLNHGGIRDLKVALTLLAEQQGVDSEQLGAIGFCMGGGFAIAWACTDNRLKAIAPFYSGTLLTTKILSLCFCVDHSLCLDSSYPDQQKSVALSSGTLSPHHLPSEENSFACKPHNISCFQPCRVFQLSQLDRFWPTDDIASSGWLVRPFHRLSLSRCASREL